MVAVSKIAQGVRSRSVLLEMKFQIYNGIYLTGKPGRFWTSSTMIIVHYWSPAIGITLDCSHLLTEWIREDVANGSLGGINVNVQRESN